MKNLAKLIFLLSITMLFHSNMVYSQIGILTCNGNLNISSTGTYEAELLDLSGAGTGHDQIIVTNDLNLDGTLDILLSGYIPDSNDAFEIMSYDGALSGVFASINWPADMINQGWAIDYGFLTPGKVTIFGPSNALPLEFLSFTVEQKDRTHDLNWETTTEINTDYFSVEFSENGIDFISLGQVKSAGNSNGIMAYNYVHHTDRAGLHYYRLQQVDLDGSYEYSNIVSINNDMELDVSFFPNPANETIVFHKVVPGITIYNTKGQVLLDMSNAAQEFDISFLTTGTYFLKIHNASQSVETLIIK